jgi:putative membrane protein
MMGGYGMMAGMGPFGMLVAALLCVVVVALVVWGLISLLRTQQGTSSADAQELLRRRYARGEISRDEFEQARQALR